MYECVHEKAVYNAKGKTKGLHMGSYISRAADTWHGS
jgi:hypothetical protein